MEQGHNCLDSKIRGVCHSLLWKMLNQKALTKRFSFIVYMNTWANTYQKIYISLRVYFSWVRSSTQLVWRIILWIDFTKYSFWNLSTPVTKRTLPLLNVLSMRHIFSSRYWSKYSYEQQMKIFWWGLFDLAFSRTKWHSLPRPIYAWVGTPSPFPKPSPVWNKCWKLCATCTS